MTELQEFMNEHGEFSKAVFGDRPPTAPLNHLLKEVKEAIEHPDDIEEYADCLLLLIDATRLAGWSANDLMQAAWHKLQKNKNRKWGQPDENGVVEHIRD